MGKWPHDNQADLIRFYGDPGSGAVAPNLIKVTPPFRMTYEGKPVEQLVFHRLAAAALQRALQTVWDYYGRDQKKIDALGISKTAGTYNHRMIRGSATKWSNHAYGAAIDINAEENGFNVEGNIPLPMIAAFKAEGARWGGDYKGRKDPMHFEFCESGEPARTFEQWLAFYGVRSSPAQPPPAAPSGAPFPSSGLGSWYSQFSGRYQWVDTGDKPGSAALGVPDDAQGVSFYAPSTLGRWFVVRAPNGVTSTEQQTDIGPHPRTGRTIDISAVAAERFGYSPKNFPTDGKFSWRPSDPPASVVGLSPREQAVKFRDLRAAAAPSRPPQPTPPPPTKEPQMEATKVLQVVWRGYELWKKIAAEWRSGPSLVQLLPKLQTFLPEAIGITQDLVSIFGAAAFSHLPAEAQVGAFDPVQARWIQTSLNTLKLADPPLVVDGYYGTKTKEAVAAFQSAHGLIADGWGGNVTRAAMQQELDKLAPPAPPAAPPAA
jgi:hypothetical protein